ncbi:hypothetical protein GOODEAATRI_018732, partial [Goodea atripinnis]
AVWQFGKMISCAQPGVNPLAYNEYGCWCGLGAVKCMINAIKTAESFLDVTVFWIFHMFSCIVSAAQTRRYIVQLTISARLQCVSVTVRRLTALLDIRLFSSENKKLDWDLSGLYGLVEERGHILLFVSVCRAENHHPILKHRGNKTVYKGFPGVTVCTAAFLLGYDPNVNLGLQLTGC